MQSCSYTYVLGTFDQFTTYYDMTITDWTVQHVHMQREKRKRERERERATIREGEQWQWFGNHTYA